MGSEMCIRDRYSGMYEKINRDQIVLLSEAHYNLSLMYTKKGWWDYALEEAELCFKLQPTKKHFELLDLIKQRSELENSDS